MRLYDFKLLHFIYGIVQTDNYKQIKSIDTGYTKKLMYYGIMSVLTQLPGVRYTVW